MITGCREPRSRHEGAVRESIFIVVKVVDDLIAQFIRNVLEETVSVYSSI